MRRLTRPTLLALATLTVLAFTTLLPVVAYAFNAGIHALGTIKGNYCQSTAQTCVPGTLAKYAADPARLGGFALGDTFIDEEFCDFYCAILLATEEKGLCCSIDSGNIAKSAAPWTVTREYCSAGNQAFYRLDEEFEGEKIDTDGNKHLSDSEAKRVCEGYGYCCGSANTGRLRGLLRNPCEPNEKFMSQNQQHSTYEKACGVTALCCEGPDKGKIILRPDQTGVDVRCTKMADVIDDNGNLNDVRALCEKATSQKPDTTTDIQGMCCIEQGKSGSRLTTKLNREQCENQSGWHFLSAENLENMIKQYGVFLNDVDEVLPGSCSPGFCCDMQRKTLHQSGDPTNADVPKSLCNFIKGKYISHSNSAYAKADKDSNNIVDEVEAADFCFGEIGPTVKPRPKQLWCCNPPEQAPAQGTFGSGLQFNNGSRNVPVNQRNGQGSQSQDEQELEEVTTPDDGVRPRQRGRNNLGGSLLDVEIFGGGICSFIEQQTADKDGNLSAFQEGCPQDSFAVVGTMTDCESACIQMGGGRGGSGFGGTTGGIGGNAGFGNSGLPFPGIQGGQGATLGGAGIPPPGPISPTSPPGNGTTAAGGGGAIGGDCQFFINIQKEENLPPTTIPPVCLSSRSSSVSSASASSEGSCPPGTVCVANAQKQCIARGGTCKATCAASSTTSSSATSSSSLPPPSSVAPSSSSRSSSTISSSTISSSTISSSTSFSRLSSSVSSSISASSSSFSAHSSSSLSSSSRPLSPSSASPSSLSSASVPSSSSSASEGCCCQFPEEETSSQSGFPPIQGRIIGSVLGLGSGDATGALTLAGMAGVAFTVYQWRRTGRGGIKKSRNQAIKK